MEIDGAQAPRFLAAINLKKIYWSLFKTETI